MSLDFYLIMPGILQKPEGIFIREDGQTKQISRAEWDERYPGQEPVSFDAEETNEVFSANITHNLNRMAGEAGIYKCLWRPDENGITVAWQVIEPLEAGLDLLISDPERFRKFDASNGWGTYDRFVPFVRQVLSACKQYPHATVWVSR